MRVRQRVRFSRRTVIGMAAGAVVAAVLTACGKGESAGVKGPVAVGTVTEVKKALADQKYVKNDAGQFYLLPAAPDAVIAVSWRCTHQGCAVHAPEGQAGQMKCPCHGSIFDGRTGTVVAGPASRPLDYLPVIVENDTVTVDTSKVMTRHAFDAGQTTPLAV
jgi:Rieske Fe-S protein